MRIVHCCWCWECVWFYLRAHHASMTRTWLIPSEALVEPPHAAAILTSGRRCRVVAWNAAAATVRGRSKGRRQFSTTRPSAWPRRPLANLWITHKHCGCAALVGKVMGQKITWPTAACERMRGKCPRSSRANARYVLCFVHPVFLQCAHNRANESFFCSDSHVGNNGHVFVENKHSCWGD